MPSRPAVFAIALAVLGLSGCASLQQPAAPAPPVALPTGWSTAASASGEVATLAQWWRRFDDPVLPTLVEQALAGSTDIAAAQARLRQARAQRDLTAAGRTLSVSGGGSAQASRRCRSCSGVPTRAS